MITRICIVICFTILSAHVFAQQAGYVVTNEGDTLRGTVTIAEGFRFAPKIISFGADKKSYSVYECQAFAIGPDEYQRAVVKMDMSYLTNLDKKILNEDSTLTAAVFLFRLYKGRNLNVYKYYDGGSRGFVRTLDVKEHYFIEDRQNIQELVVKYSYGNKRKAYDYDMDAVNTKRMFSPQYISARELWPIYKEQLSYYYDFDNDKKLRKKIDGMEYREDHILKIVQEIDAKFKPSVQ